MKALAAKRLPGLQRAPLRIAYVAQEELHDFGGVSALQRIVSGDERLEQLAGELEAMEDSPDELSESSVLRMEQIMEEVGLGSLAPLPCKLLVPICSWCTAVAMLTYSPNS